MAHLDLDFTAPIALLAGAIVAVLVVRALTVHGDSRAAARTQRLLREHSKD
ncbi:MAG: hypothetical protein KF729_14940 [Sandaracinaceae bacterium]|nr:hypothetical protein [Sandaracinaceae bacterium]